MCLSTCLSVFSAFLVYLQEGDMLWVFLLVVQALQQYSSVASLSSLSKEDLQVLEAFMSLANMALSWNFSTRYRMNKCPYVMIN